MVYIAQPMSIYNGMYSKHLRKITIKADHKFSIACNFKVPIGVVPDNVIACVHK